MKAKNISGMFFLRKSMVCVSLAGAFELSTRRSLETETSK